jgi:hypothetical protein
MSATAIRGMKAEDPGLAEPAHVFQHLLSAGELEASVD